jgi:hypothetical protein
MSTRWWRVLTIVAAAVLYAIATSNRAYNLTTPVTMPMHTAVRKILALLAFALLGWLLQRSNVRGMRGTLAVAIAIAWYSFAIEIGQVVIGGSRETIAQHAFDVTSGLAGGALGAFVLLLVAAPAARARRREAGGIALLGILLACWFPMTYGRYATGSLGASARSGATSAAVAATTGSGVPANRDERIDK